MTPTSEFDSILAIADKLSGVSFAALMVLVLFGSYFGIWVWGRTHRESLAEKVTEAAALRTDFIRREDELQRRNDQLLELTMRASGLVEQSVSIVKRQT